MEPGARECPVSPDRSYRNSKRLSSLLKTQTAKKPQFYDTALAWIERGKSAQRFIQCDEVALGLGRDEQRIVKCDLLRVTSMLEAVMVAREIHEDMPH